MPEFRSSQPTVEGGNEALYLEDLTAARRREWDERITRQPSAHFFHSSPWMEVLREAYGFKGLYLAFQTRAEVSALLPMVEVSSRRIGLPTVRGVSLPFADECAPLVLSEQPVDLLRPLIAFGKARGWRHFEVRGTATGFKPNTPSVSFLNHELALDANPEVMLKRLKGPVRTALRKSEASGLQVDIADSIEALRDFHQLYRITRRKHGLPPQPWSFFSAIHAHVFKSGLAKVVLARQAGRAIAGAVFFQGPRKVLFKYGASDPRHQDSRANNAVMWAAMKWYGGQGREFLDLGRTSLNNEGLRRFKLGWGASERTLHYAKYDLRADRFVTETDQASGPHNWVFRHAPLWMSSLAGKILYKHWA